MAIDRCQQFLQFLGHNMMIGFHLQLAYWMGVLPSWVWTLIILVEVLWKAEFNIGAPSTVIVAGAVDVIPGHINE